MKNKIITTAIIVSAFTLGWFLHPEKISDQSSSENQNSENPACLNDNYELRAGGYQYINPLLECEVVDGNNLVPLKSLKVKLEDLIKKEKEKNNIKEASVYIRDLNNGPWLGINERAEFAPASLLKVPVMIAFFKLAEEDKDLLDQKIKYTGEFENINNLENKEKSIIPDQSYSIGELIEKMIVYSDNKSKSVLKEYLKNKISSVELQKTAAEIGLIMPVGDETSAEVNVKSYAGVFRVLYNASYLNKEMSEKALELLAGSEFKIGIAASLPDGIQLSHKYGFFENQGQLSQLHDCGIVYLTKRPVLICIMTKFSGQDIEKPASVVREIAGNIIDYYQKSSDDL